MLRAGDKRIQDRKALIEKIRLLKEKKESGQSYGNIQVHMAVQRPSNLVENVGSNSASTSSSAAKNVKWEDLERQAREERDNKKELANKQLKSAAKTNIDKEDGSGKNRSGSLTSERAYSLQDDFDSDSEQIGSDPQVPLDDDEVDGYVGPEEEKDEAPVLIAAGMFASSIRSLTASDVPLTFDTSKFSRLSMTMGGNPEIMRKIWPCALALLIANLSRLLVMNSLPQVSRHLFGH